MHMETMRELYVAELEDLYSAEQQLVEALPKFVNRATTLELKMAFEAHLEETKKHVRRLDRVFETLELRPRGPHSVMMERLIEKTQKLVVEETQGDVLDAALIARVHHVEHYEIAGYGTLKTYAIILGEVAHLRLFQQTVHEEAVADDWLTEIAHTIDVEWAIRNGANRKADDREVLRPLEIDREEPRDEPRRLHSPSWDAILDAGRR